MRRRRFLQSNDDGSVLLMALIFITAVGGLTVSLLSFASTNLVATRSTDTHARKLYAASAGIDYALRQLASNAALCGAGSTAVTNITMPAALQVNGRTPTGITCQSTTSSTGGADGWAAFITGDGVTGAGIRMSGASAKVIDGPVYNGDQWTSAGPSSAWSVGSGGLTVTKSVLQNRSGSATCPASVPNLTVTGGLTCTTTPLTTPASPQALPASLPAAAPAATTVGNCKVFSPGTYTSAPVLDTTPGRVNYFKGGVYYFNLPGRFLIGGSVLGGRPSNGESQVTTMSCPGVTDSGGVMWIFGGATSFDYAAGAQVEVFPMNVNGRRGVSFYQITTEPAPWAAPITGSENEFEVESSSLTWIVHGMVYAPLARMEFESTGQIQVRGGVVVASLSIDTSSPTIGFSGIRTVTVTSTAAALSGEIGAPVTITAVVTVPTNGVGGIQIASWRVSS